MAAFLSCPHCQESTSQDELRAHLSSDLDYFPFKCILCGARFTSWISALLHFDPKFSDHPGAKPKVAQFKDPDMELRLSALMQKAASPLEEPSDVDTEPPPAKKSRRDRQSQTKDVGPTIDSVAQTEEPQPVSTASVTVQTINPTHEHTEVQTAVDSIHEETQTSPDSSATVATQYNSADYKDSEAQTIPVSSTPEGTQTISQSLKDSSQQTVILSSADFGVQVESLCETETKSATMGAFLSLRANQRLARCFRSLKDFMKLRSVSEDASVLFPVSLITHIRNKNGRIGNSINKRWRDGLGDVFRHAVSVRDIQISCFDLHRMPKLSSCHLFVTAAEARDNDGSRLALRDLIQSPNTRLLDLSWESRAAADDMLIILYTANFPNIRKLRLRGPIRVKAHFGVFLKKLSAVAHKLRSLTVHLEDLRSDTDWNNWKRLMEQSLDRQRISLLIEGTKDWHRPAFPTHRVDSPNPTKLNMFEFDLQGMNGRVRSLVCTRPMTAIYLNTIKGQFMQFIRQLHSLKLILVQSEDNVTLCRDLSVAFNAAANIQILHLSLWLKGNKSNNPAQVPILTLPPNIRRLQVDSSLVRPVGPVHGAMFAASGEYAHLRSIHTRNYFIGKVSTWTILKDRCQFAPNLCWRESDGEMETLSESELHWKYCPHRVTYVEPYNDVGFRVSMYTA